LNSRAFCENKKVGKRLRTRNPRIDVADSFIGK
jgi:hypothetical protein